MLAVTRSTDGEAVRNADRLRSPDQRARPGGGRWRKGEAAEWSRNPKGGALQTRMKPRRVPLRSSPFGVIRTKGGIRKGGFHKGED